MNIYTKDWYFNGVDLIAEREKLELTQAEFAKIAGWSRQYQTKLEVPMAHLLTSQIHDGLRRHKIYLCEIRNATGQLLDAP